ncbi:L,D-transpeptidase family protein [Streptomyces palmae]|uniref:Murein L,D-transpeptidase n=1 Tax=Streptomyces palmae TaxID=1701085 RepID=A0A4Z0GYI2_9ACTN|nr:L,D-transpeptidase family protein [Streptomyces palmae]TGB01788.1 murein L,D-transpeptidase [Streptomyces palmae]
MKRSRHTYRATALRTAVAVAAAATLAAGCGSSTGLGSDQGHRSDTGSARAGGGRLDQSGTEKDQVAAARAAERAADREVALESGPEGISPATGELPAAPAGKGGKSAPIGTLAGRGDSGVLSVGSSGPRVRELQARLQQAGVFSLNPTGYFGPITKRAVTSFQKRHHIRTTGNAGPLTWKALNRTTHKPTRLELYPVTTRPIAKPDKRCLTGRVLCISKKSRTLTWMVNGKVKAAMDVRFGAQYTPTREGRFKMYWKNRNHVSTIYHTPMPYSMFFSGGQAVHYSADFAARGYNGASHGCVNVRDRAKLAKLFDQVRVGDKVVVYR